jgi:hypothetical protein
MHIKFNRTQTGNVYFNTSIMLFYFNGFTPEPVDTVSIVIKFRTKSATSAIAMISIIYRSVNIFSFLLSSKPLKEYFLNIHNCSNT